MPAELFSNLFWHVDEEEIRNIREVKLSSYFMRTNSRDCDKYYSEGTDMQDSSYPHFISDDDLSPQDDVDRLFLQLETISPPSSLVDTILSSVARLPRHKLLSDVDDAKRWWQEIDDLVVHNSHLQPS